MKSILKTITAGMAALAIAATTVAPVSAADNNIQPRGSWHVYGDVNDDGAIDIRDTIAINQAINKYKELTGDANLPVTYAVARPSIYFANLETPVPQAADVNGDGYINEEDSEKVMHAIVHLDDIGRCGEHFYIN